MTMNTISRRTLLRGAGAAVALPLLDAMTPSFAKATEGEPPFAQSKTPGKPPVRIAFFYVPNGVHMANWRPQAAGELNDLPSILKPLEPTKNNVLVLSDLAADHCQNSVAAHEPSGGGF